jgi:hypothetical protein
MFKLLSGKWMDEVSDSLEELEKSIAKFSKENKYDDGNIVSYQIVREPKAYGNPGSSYIYMATALVAFYEKAHMIAPLLVGRVEEPMGAMVDMTGDPDISMDV